MLLGNLIKDKRKKMGLSQKELMQGIGSLVMISKIENENKAPSIDSLIKLLNRLNLTLNDVFSEYADYGTNNDYRLTLQSELYFYNGNYKLFQDKLHFLDQLDNNESDQAILNFLHGIYFLLVKKSNDEAIFELNEALQDTKNDHYEKLLIYALLGKAYYNKGMNRAALKYFTSAIDYIYPTNMTLSTVEVLRIISALYYSAEFMYTQDSGKADKLAEKALDLSSEYHLSHYSDKLARLLAKSENNDKKISAYYQRIANTLQQINQKVDVQSV